MNFKLIGASVIVLFVVETQKVNAEGYINIVNPARIAPYTVNLSGNLQTQYNLLSQYNFPATWLLTYDVMKSSEAIAVIKKFNSNQEIGIFLEISPNLAKSSDVLYNNTGSWHHASSIFLSGYNQDNRRKMIDVMFGEYKKIFGNYPKTIGSWWTDSYSLSYMKNKYNITGNVDCSDQQDTDGYTIRGQYWSIPFYPWKNNAARPAGNIADSLGVVTIQWAPRDPLKGYENSKYSSQDYFTLKNLDINYYKNLINIYTGVRPIGQITLGLESDLSPQAYLQDYSQQLKAINEKKIELNLKVVSVGEFTKKYSDTFPNGTPSVELISPDILNSETQSIWYQSPFYRINYVINKDSLAIRDLREYQLLSEEEFYRGINGQNMLHIHTPAIIDSVVNKDEMWILPRDTIIKLNSDNINISSSKNIDIPSVLKYFPGISLKSNKHNLEIKFNNIIINSHEFNYLSAESKHFFNQKKFPIDLLRGRGWDKFKKVKFQITQDEYIALIKLKSLPKGKVIVASSECLQCKFSTKYPHPAFANNRNYVTEVSGKDVIYDPGVLNTNDRETSKKRFDQSKARYIYLIKIDNYLEKLPFSPGDTGVKKVFENSTSVIWEKSI